MRADRTARRPARWPIAVLAVAIAAEFTTAVGGAVFVATVTRTPALDGGTHARPAPPLSARDASGQSGAQAARTAAVRHLLDERSRALLARNRTGFLAGVDPASSSVRDREAQLFDNLRSVPLAEWSYTLDSGADPAASSGGSTAAGSPWAPRVELHYRIAGFDAQPSVEPTRVTFVQRGGRWYLGANPSTPDSAGIVHALWDFGPVVTARTANTLVLGHPRSRSLLPSLARVCEAAIPRVTAVWGRDWARKLVVLVPDTQPELAGIIGERTDLSQIAAVATATVSQRDAAPVGERVVINPANFAKLGALGRRVVLQHEITHVATRAHTTGATPAWLAEGFADYVGYLGAGVDVPSAARELAVDVRRGSEPSRLPSDADFAGGNPRLAQTYEMAWLACRLIAELSGSAGLVAFYRSVGSYRGSETDAVAAALREHLRLSTEQFTQRWRGYLSERLR